MHQMTNRRPGDMVREQRLPSFRVTHLSAESIFEVEVKEGGWSLGSNSRLKIEFVTLEDIVNILGLPVNNSPEKLFKLKI